jgi:CMP-N-acetylneuraminic acid synthetase
MEWKMLSQTIDKAIAATTIALLVLSLGVAAIELADNAAPSVATKRPQQARQDCASSGAGRLCSQQQQLLSSR